MICAGERGKHAVSGAIREQFSAHGPEALSSHLPPGDAGDIVPAHFKRVNGTIKDQSKVRFVDGQFV